MRVGRRVVAGVLAAGLLASCGGDDARPAPGSDGRPVAVSAAFYPLAWVVERVGGPYVTVANLTPAGAEPHDLELSASQIGKLSEADLVVYLAGFSPAVDEAVRTAGKVRALDVGTVAGLDLQATDEEGHVGADPHFWLDPLRLARVADAVADRLAGVRPDSEGAFRANAAAVRADLEALDAAFTQGLATCRSRQLVVSHAAFGYLAQRYGLQQRAVTGLTPDEEPTPADLADLTRFVRANDVGVIYTETLVSPAVAETVARETGASTAVLDPLEGLAEGTAGDYLSIMRANLATLRQGQGCT